MTDDRKETPSWAGPWLGERALAQATERYASLFTHHPHAAYSVDDRGYFTDANQRALEMTGLTLKEMRESHFAAVIHPDDLDVFQEGFDRVMGGEPQLLEGRVVRTDGRHVDIRCTAIPVVVDDEVVGVHGITEDVTAANDVLRQLEEANAAKTLFLATVSHEVRTPLAALVGATELLMDTDLEGESAHYATIVHRSSERLMRLVQDILEFSGLEAHQTVLHPRPFGVRAAVADIEGWACPLAEGRGLTASFEVDPSVPGQVVGDRRRISQVVTNLVHNALTFTEQGGVDVTVTAAGSEAEPWLTFAVRDTGVGIAADQLPGLFSPFRQAEPHLAGDRHGMGLGLAISRDLVDLMDGVLSATSTPGEGSTFTVRVPLQGVDATSPM